MCIRNATKSGVKYLPVWAYYYKRLFNNISLVKHFKYHKGINEIPEEWQDNGGRKGNRIIVGGGHFYRDKRDAKIKVYGEQRIVTFKILRRDISHVGKTHNTDKGVTVLARRAEML